MKKLTLIAFSWLIFASCTKTVSSPEDLNRTEYKSDETGGVRPVRAYGARVALDGTIGEGGRGWYLQVNEYEWEVPVNMPDKFKVQNMLVDVVYYRTDKEFKCKECIDPKYMVEIVKIERISDDKN